MIFWGPEKLDYRLEGASELIHSYQDDGKFYFFFKVKDGPEIATKVLNFYTEDKEFKVKYVESDDPEVYIVYDRPGVYHGCKTKEYAKKLATLRNQSVIGLSRE